MLTYSNSRSSQQGASLLVALVFLVVLTAAGITAVRLATNEERMAGGSQARGSVLQLGQSEINAQLIKFNGNIVNRTPLLDAISVSTNGETNSTLLARFPQMKDFIDLAYVQATTHVTYADQIRTLGEFDCGVLGLGDTFENFTCHNYEVIADARLSNGTYSNQTQGLYFLNLK